MRSAERIVREELARLGWTATDLEGHRKGEKSDRQSIVGFCAPAEAGYSFEGNQVRMINRVTGEIDFRSGLRIVPHSRVTSLSATPNAPLKIQTRKLGLKDWRRYVLGPHTSEYGIFAVEALTQADDCIRVVLLSHQHSFYERGTADDAERRAFHEGVIHSDLGGQKEFSWGEVMCHLAKRTNKDWLIVGYSRDPRVPAPDKEVLLTLFAHEKPPES